MRVTEKLTDDMAVATDELKEVFPKGRRRSTAVSRTGE